MAWDDRDYDHDSKIMIMQFFAILTAIIGLILMVVLT